ncbi:MAG: acyl-CoA dehydrogenase family protein [Xanthobacteraceae bacterium]
MSLLESRNGTRPVSVLSSTLAAPAETADRVIVPGTLAERAQAVAAIAVAHAPAVDRAARFPVEAFRAAKDHRLLGIMVPTELGGEGASIGDVVDVCYALGRGCGSTGLIYAMHQMMVACLIKHGFDNAWHQNLVRRIDADQLLLASSTTEGQGGGDLRKSSCAVEQQGSVITLTKSATVVSYGAQADALVTTARRSPEAPASDQVLVAFCKGDYRLDNIAGWDTLGMRGTCSAGFNFEGSGIADQVMFEPYQKIHAQTGMPVAHLTWSAVWAGVAASAVDRAQAFVRKARGPNGQMPPGAGHLTRATASLRTLGAVITSALARYESACRDDTLESLDFQTGMNLLKVTASELAIETVSSALQASGLAGYRNDGEFSVTRHLRDAMSSSVMINNDRILANVANASLLVDIPTFLTK